MPDCLNDGCNLMDKSTQHIESSKPYFICVGPHKTGTAWLHRVIDAHKEMKKSKIKEIDYFHYLEKVQKKGKLWTQLNQIRQLPQRKVLKKRLRKRIKLLITGKLDERTKRLLNHEWRCISGTFTLDFYTSFFEHPESKIGDISPKYFFLQKTTIQYIKKLYPNIKILIFLREPIARLSSHTKMYLINHPNLKRTDDNIKKVIAFLQKHETTYPDKGLQNWLEVFDKKQLFIGFYEDLKDDPVEYFKSICRFLEIDDDIENSMDFQKVKATQLIKGKEQITYFENVAELIRFQYNKSSFDLEMPEDLNSTLVDYYYEKVQYLTEIYEHPYPKQWLAKYDKIRRNSISE